MAKMREEGIEPPTAGSGIQRSTTELFPHFHSKFAKTTTTYNTAHDAPTNTQQQHNTLHSPQNCTTSHHATIGLHRQAAQTQHTYKPSPLMNRFDLHSTPSLRPLRHVEQSAVSPGLKHTPFMSYKWRTALTRSLFVECSYRGMSCIACDLSVV